MPIGTPLYPICNPGETVNVTKSSGGGGGLVAEFRQGEWIFQYMHLSEVFTGVRKYGEPICKSGNSGNSSGPHLHFTQRKASDRSTVPPAAGYIFFAVTGRSPS
jgi:murein DD-endopeptidase MepM/ murein hydrolase activator NlpD